MIHSSPTPTCSLQILDNPKIKAFPMSTAQLTKMAKSTGNMAKYVATKVEEYDTSKPAAPTKPKPSTRSLHDTITIAINAAIRERREDAHILITISPVPVLWNEQYKPYFKYLYLLNTEHRIPLLELPLDPKLQEDLDFLEMQQYMKCTTHSVGIYVRDRLAVGSGESVRVVEVDMIPKYRAKDAANEKKAEEKGKVENGKHGVGNWLKCKGRKEGGVCDCVLEPRTVWDETCNVKIN
jgi:hypothetical protein